MSKDPPAACAHYLVHALLHGDERVVVQLDVYSTAHQLLQDLDVQVEHRQKALVFGGRRRCLAGGCARCHRGEARRCARCRRGEAASGHLAVRDDVLYRPDVIQDFWVPEVAM